MWECLEFIIADLFKMKMVWLYNLNLEQEMKNLACGDLTCTEKG